MSVNVGNLFRKRTLRRGIGANAPIIELVDETDGGYIIRGGQVVNQEKWDIILKREEDKRKAAEAQAHAISHPKPPEERNTAPSKVQELEKRMDSIEGSLTKILDILQKK